MSKKKKQRAPRAREDGRVAVGSTAGANPPELTDSGRYVLPGAETLPPLYRYAILLSRHSFWARVVSRLGFSYDDKAAVLASSPLGMFFYNQRFLFFTLGFLYIIALLIAATFTRTENSKTTVALVFAFWCAAVLITWVLHKSFIRKVALHLQHASASDFPPVFYPYVVLDSALVLGLVLFGKWFHVDLHYFAFLLLANTIVYCACAGAYVASRRTYAAIPVLLLIFVASLVLATQGLRNDVFAAFRDIGPVLGMAVVAVMAVAIVSAVRQREQKLMDSQVEMLGRIEEDLGGSNIYHPRPEARLTAKDQFDQRLRVALKRLTENPFGYRAARLWFIDERDETTSFLLPGPFHGMKSFYAPLPSLEASSALLQAREPCIVMSSRNLAILPEPVREDPEIANETAAYVPVLAKGRLAALLALYGLPEDPGASHHQKPFLHSVSAIIADTLVQADGRHSSQAQEAMDALFLHDSLSDVLPRTADVFMRSTRAEACLIAIRNASDSMAVDVIASSGFRGKMKGTKFVGNSVAEVSIRNQPWLARDSEIGADVRLQLETLLGKPVYSTLAIPFSADQISGVVLLVNSTGRAPWFSQIDVHLSRRLAHVVGRLIERFDRIERTQKSLELAEEGKREATEAKLRAEDLAKQLQNNLMVMTHQLQAPLSSIRASVLRLRRKVQQPDTLRYFEHIQGLVEDSFALCWGTVATFAKDAGSNTSIDLQDVDAMPELESLAARMQKTNARDDLKFEFRAETDFPHIRIDKFVFTSVFYSLLHNAMKYADRNSRVEMVCGFENGKAALKLKSFGEPIDPDEKEEIFKMYKRGRVVTETGRHHAGVGLGLWVARQLLNEVDGTIDVEVSNRLSIFIVRCPVADAGGQA
jgi:signal transduction histidine kinase